MLVREGPVFLPWVPVPQPLRESLRVRKEAGVARVTTGLSSFPVN